jgi:hypothetical protein
MLKSVDGSTEMKELRDTRNVLAHRTAPGRQIGLSAGSAGETMWLGGPLRPQTTAEPRAWTSKQLDEILGAAEQFVSDHF